MLEAHGQEIAPNAKRAAARERHHPRRTARAAPRTSRCANGAAHSKLLTLRVFPPAHPETTPRRVEVVREVGMHTEQQRAGEPSYPKRGRKEEESEEEEEEEAQEKEGEEEEDEEE